MKNRVFGLLLILLLIPIVSASLEIEKDAVRDTIISELNGTAVFDFQIKNTGVSDTFRIYSITGVRMTPEDEFDISSGGTENVIVEIWPGVKVLSESEGTFNFIYKIEGEKAGIHEEVLSIKIISLEDAMEINAYNVNVNSTTATIYVKNNVGLEYDVKARFYSTFFDFDEEFTLGEFERKEFEVPLNTGQVKSMNAGSYTITSEIEVDNVLTKIEDSFRFTEKADITTSEVAKGVVINTLIIEKTNQGNLPFVVQVKVEKNILSRLFTVFNSEPASIARDGFLVTYTFQKEIKPSESFTVRAVTNWFYPLLLLLALIVIGLLLKAYTSTHVVLRKRATFVKTKGGEFALKITLIAKAKSYVEKIHVIDRIPHMVKLYKRFGTTEPDKIDTKHRRLEWNIDSLQEGEERIFSYVIYSRVSPVGKFELPTGAAMFEKDGKLHETESNKVFFLTEPKEVD